MVLKMVNLKWHLPGDVTYPWRISQYSYNLKEPIDLLERSRTNARGLVNRIEKVVLRAYRFK
jgi:hypothetical protein